MAKHIHGARTSRCVHGRSESVMPRTVARTRHKSQCAMEHVITCIMPKIANVCATRPQMACGRTLSNVPWRNVTLTHSLARTHSAQTNAHPAGAMGGGARAHAPHTFTHGPVGRRVGRGSQASPPQPACHAMSSLSPPRPLSLPLSPFVVTPRGTRPTFPNWASRS